MSFAVTGADASPNEPFSPDASETARTAGFAWGVDTSTWARLRGVGLEQAAIRSAWLDDCARRIAGTGSDEDKLARLFAFVVRRIEPANAPDDAVAVLATGQGARTPLLLALARGAGLDAVPVALQLATQPDPATFDAGSWSIVAAKIRVGGDRDGGRDSYAIVDGNAVLDKLPPVARGARVLDLSQRPGAAAVTSVLPDEVVDDSGVHVQVDLGLDAGGRSLSGLIVVTVPAGQADGARRGVRRATPDQLKVVVERAFADSLPGLSVVDVKTPNLDAAGMSLRLGARVQVPLPDDVNGAARFDHLFAQGASGGMQLAAPLGAYLAVADRKQPLLVLGDREVLEVQLSLPPTAAFVEAPDPLSRTAGPFALEQKVEITNGLLYWRREIRKENARVPVDAWPAVRAGLAALAARTDARLSFVVPKHATPTTSTSGEKRASVEQNR